MAHKNADCADNLRSTVGKELNLTKYGTFADQNYCFQITLKSTDIPYTSISLLTTLAAVFLCFVANQFKLDRRLGFSCLFFYILFVVFAFFTETRVFYLVSPTPA